MKYKYIHTLKRFLRCVASQSSELSSSRLFQCMFFIKENKFKPQIFQENLSFPKCLHSYSEMNNFNKETGIWKTSHPLTVLFTLLFTGKTDIWG